MVDILQSSSQPRNERNLLTGTDLGFRVAMHDVPVTGNPVMTASEVKSHSSIDRFLVVFHSPTGMAETGLLACRSEKTGRVSRCNANTMDFLWSGLTMKTSQLAGISRDYRGTASGFLCTSDYMAEREGFEPSIQVLARITV